MNTEVEIIMGQFERIFNEYEALWKQPIKYNENTVLYRSELHMIEVVLTLTERGNKAFESHKEYNKKMYEDFEIILNKYPKETCKALT